MAADERNMWINALSIIRVSDETAIKVGREVIDMVKQSMRSDRERDELEPIGHVTIEISAS